MSDLLLPAISHVAPGRGHVVERAGEPRLLFEADWSVRPLARVPSVANAQQDFAGWTGVNLDHLWLGNVSDVIGSEDLTASDGILVGRDAVGLWDGSGVANHKCAEAILDTEMKLEAAGDVTLGRLTTSTFFAALLRFRGLTLVSNRAVISKRQANPSDNEGHQIQLRSSDGGLQWVIDGGPSITQATLATSYQGGHWFWLIAYYDHVTGEVVLATWLETDRAAVPGGDFTADSDTPLQVGDSDLSPSSPLQVAAFGVAQGAALAGFSDGDLKAMCATLQNHDTDSSGKIDMDAGSIRDGLAADVVGWNADLGEPYVGYAQGDGSSARLLYGWRDWIRTTQKVQVYAWDGGSPNMVTDSEDLATLLTPQGTAAAVETEDSTQQRAPDGFAGAQRLSGSAAGDYYDVTITGLTAATPYILSAWMRAPEGFGGDKRWRVMNAAASAELASDLFTVSELRWGTGDPEESRQYLAFTTAAGETSVQLRFFPGDDLADASDVFLWGIQVEEVVSTSDFPSPYMPTFGSTVTRPVNQLHINTVSDLGLALDDVMRGDVGEVQVEFSADQLESPPGQPTRDILDIVGSPTATDRRNYELDATDWLQTLLYDSNGSLHAFEDLDGVVATRKHKTLRHQWNRGAGQFNGAFSRIRDEAGNAQEEATSVWPYTAGSAGNRIVAGNRNGGGTGVEGGLIRIRTYSKPKTDRR